MAGPLARLLAQVVVPVVAVLARAIPAAYAQALRNARTSGAAAEAAKASGSLLRKTMSREEALQVLNVDASQPVTPEAVQKQFDKYFAANAVKNGGGSFYLQSKIYRAKELLDEYQAEHAANEREDRQAEAENQAASDQRQKEQESK